MKYGTKTGAIMPLMSKNGSDPEMMMEHYHQAIEALDRCVAMIDLARNARDYQSLTLEGQMVSLNQFSEVALKLRGVREYLEDHVTSISEQIDERRVLTPRVALHVRKPGPEEPDE
jgi:hypothetical protein